MKAWFICGYKRSTERAATRYCAMDDFTSQIYDASGRWTESEVLGGYALVKVDAPEALLDAIDATPGFVRVPRKLSLTDALSDLTQAEKTRIKNIVNAMGYTNQEIQQALGTDIGSRTLGDLLRFIAKRRRRPRYVAVTDEILLDGDVLPCRPVEEVDAEV